MTEQQGKGLSCEQSWEKLNTVWYGQQDIKSESAEKLPGSWGLGLEITGLSDLSSGVRHSRTRISCHVAPNLTLSLKSHNTFTDQCILKESLPLMYNHGSLCSNSSDLCLKGFVLDPFLLLWPFHVETHHHHSEDTPKLHTDPLTNKTQSADCW